MLNGKTAPQMPFPIGADLAPPPAPGAAPPA
jgi:hypothetical protein